MTTDPASPGDDLAHREPAPLRIRWWPAALIVVLAAATISLAWIHPTLRATAQYQSMWTQAVLLLSALLLCIWFVLASGFSARLRGRAALGIAIVVAGLATFFRVEGVTGDLRPIIAPRFASSAVADVQPGHNRAVELVPTPNDFPQFLGPNRDCRVPNVRLETDWSAHPPKLLWRHPVGSAWSGFVTVGEFAFTQQQHDEDEQVVCYALENGEPVWRYGYPAEYASVIAGTGPRATPTIMDGKLYAMGSTGHLACLNAADGAEFWTRDTLADAKAPNREWGVACSPLVIGDKVIVSSGGKDGWSLVAYETNSGAITWHAGDSPASYASPVFVTLLGVPQILIVNNDSVAAHDPEDGHILWQHPWGSGDSICANPIVIGDDQVFLSAGYGYGCILLQLAKDDAGKITTSEPWPRNRNMKFKFTNGVFREGHIYGLDDGVLACLELKTGKRKWKAGRYGHGQLLLVEDVLVIQAEAGELVLVRCNPEKLEELSTFPVFDDKTWNTPALAGDRLLVRNDKHAACFQLPAQESPAP